MYLVEHDINDGTLNNLYSRVQHPMLTLAINSVRVREYPLTCKESWDNGTVSHDFYHALLPNWLGGACNREISESPFKC